MKQNNPKSQNFQIKYKQLSYEERIKIATFLIVGKTITEIAKLLNRNKSSISREINRNKNKHTNIYDYHLANGKKHRRKKNACKKERLLNSKTRRLVAECIQEGHSPRTVASILEEQHNIKINYESIYQWIYKRKTRLNRLSITKA